jgi:hypothetical protein
MQFKSQDENPYSFNVKLDGTNFRLDQDVSHYRDYALEMKKSLEGQTRKPHYRLAMIIPDIVAIDILVKYGIDVHHPNFMHDKDQIRRVEKIMQNEYSDLVMDKSPMQRF